MSKKSKFNKHIIYGKILNYDEIIYQYDEQYIYPLASNGIQGEDSILFIKKIQSFNGIEVYIDLEDCRDGSDVLFIYFNTDVDIQDMKKIMEIINKTKPDEFNFNDKLDCLRLWWD